MHDFHCHVATGQIGENVIVHTTDNVAGRLICATQPADWGHIAAAAAGWPGTVAAYGVHPWHAGGAGVLTELETALPLRLRDDSAAWVGEIGLDAAKRDVVSADAQRDVFSRQLRLAARYGRRVNVHCVRAWEEVLQALDKEYLSGGGREGCILHAFSGPEHAITAYAERGAYFTVGPLSRRHGSRKAADRARALPEDRLLLESDAFLTPGEDDAGSLRETLIWLAAVRGMSPATLAQRLETNAAALLRSV